MGPIPDRSAPTGRLARLRAGTRRLARAREGAAAVEFAMVALPFLMLLFGILELAMIFVLSTALDNATAVAARTIRTGQLQTAGGGTANSFSTAICNSLGWMSSASCMRDLKVDVRTFPTFSSINVASPLANGSFNNAAVTFVPGGPGDIVVVRAFYQWTLFTPLLSQAVSNVSGNKKLITSTIAFRNEPY